MALKTTQNLHIVIIILLATGSATWDNMSVKDFLASLQLDHLMEVFVMEHITMDVLVDMTNDDLQSIGITAFGHRHKILKKVKELTQTGGAGIYISIHTPLHDSNSPASPPLPV